MCFTPALRADEPFTASATIQTPENGKPILSVSLSMAKDHYLYADQVDVAAKGLSLVPRDIPKPKEKFDEVFGARMKVYDHDVVLQYEIKGLGADPIEVRVGYQGCGKGICFPPATATLQVAPGKVAVREKAPAPGPPDAALRIPWGPLAEEFTITGRAAGYLKPKTFIRFLDDVEAGQGLDRNNLRQTLEQKGVWILILFIVIGGLALNLTPCVLPMIPINLAIIGAGTQAGSRGRGFALGATYGTGIALVYGVLGLAVVLTGTKFGTLNASPIFNLAVAVVFGVLSLAMFGLFNLDFSRFQTKLGTQKGRRGPFVTAFIIGGIAALLAGACVAPVVISVLVLSADLYAKGNVAGLALPFLLGLGMALPWPFAGAGLSFLPKPGKWMEKVKVAFGVIIVLAALYYGYLGLSLLQERSGASREAVASAQQESVKKGWLTSLEQALPAAKSEGKRVFIDFWASWCKNCLKMEKSTFVDPDVRRKLEPFVLVKVRAEDLKDPDVKATLDYFGVIGLPTYVILEPKKD
jgi:thiol:disulfide interchange protein